MHSLDDRLTCSGFAQRGALREDLLCSQSAHGLSFSSDLSFRDRAEPGVRHAEGRKEFLGSSHCAAADEARPLLAANRDSFCEKQGKLQRENSFIKGLAGSEKSLQQEEARLFGGRGTSDKSSGLGQRAEDVSVSHSGLLPSQGPEGSEIAISSLMQESNSEFEEELGALNQAADRLQGALPSINHFLPFYLIKC